MFPVVERFDETSSDVEVLDSGHWTLFEDAFADGKLKFKNFEHIIVQGKEQDALALFMNITHIDPKRVTCNCCGQHFSIREYNSVYQATGFQRGCKFDQELRCYVEELDDFPISIYMSLEDFIESPNVLLIYADGSTNKFL